MLWKSGDNNQYFIKENGEWKRKDNDNLDQILLELGLSSSKRMRKSKNQVLDNFKQNFDEWKKDINSDLENRLKKEVVWIEDKKDREEKIQNYINNTLNNDGINNYYRVCKNFKSLEIYKNFYYSILNDEKASRKEIHKFILANVGSKCFGDKLYLRFKRFCDISPLCGNAWWSICSVPTHHWTIPTKNEWDDLIDKLKLKKQ